MVVLVLIALQVSNAGLSNSPPFEERLRFEFFKESRGGPARITGRSENLTNWSLPSFSKIVRKCGGRRTGALRPSGFSIVVTGESRDNNLEVVRCVQAATSVRFTVGIASTGLSSGPFEQEAFRSFWDS